MTNHFAVGAHRHKNGYLAWYRRVHRAINEILKDDNGAEIIFDSPADAKAAAADELCRYLNTDIACSGIIPSIRDAKRAAAEKQFKARAEA